MSVGVVSPRSLPAVLLVLSMFGCARQHGYPVAAPCPNPVVSQTPEPAEAVAGLDEEERAAHRIAKACVANEPGACSRLASMLRGPEPAAPPRAPSVAKPDVSDEAKREAALGQSLMDDPGPDRLRAPEHLKRACDLDHGGACNDLGVAWSKGFGAMERDEARAGRLYERACKLGHSLGCLNRGRLARSSNSGLAADYLSGGCKLGREDACVELAGVVRDAEAACKKSNASCNNWGVILEFGFGITQDKSEALAAYERACFSRVARACNNAGLIHREGSAGKKDGATAKARFETACKLGEDAACVEAKRPATEARD